MFFGIFAYLLWGLFPAYFPLLEPAAPLEIIAHRIIWTLVFMAGVLTFTRRWHELFRASPRTWLRLSASGLLIAVNWLVYVIAVNSGHVADAALGYFINPLVSVVLGVVFLHERLRRLQVFSVGIAAAAVLLLTIVGGQPPIMGLLLAFSFGLYGLVKKGVSVSPQASVTAETIVTAPFALGYVAWLEASGSNSFAAHGVDHALLLVSTGVVTAVPLLLFGAAAKRIPLATIGMLQYITPTMQMLWAVFIMHEHLSTVRWIGFVVIWVSVALYLIDLSIRQRGRARG
ncbi:EamA family transporter RarD [Corynebacterium pelargi]|uniref:Putative DMT superfamily transporter inner membrane protein n=1 Tax=Corynebacterium pelargi TaxID=1471400 RepID=A0A410W7X2_9CORY|nr:EamA family transporter RarD [Corynebacterium pelargi]QAU52057.1 putative DMT superfamily transporter inner membrane protein [Corynebacterium pelargi]GGG70450.1 permease [Corynebacterium pelargi]